MKGESGRNELLRGPFALFGVRSSAKLVRDLAKHRRTPMSPPQLIPPTSPVQVIAGTEDSGGSFRGTGHGPFRTRPPTSVKLIFNGGKHMTKKEAMDRAETQVYIYMNRGEIEEACRRRVITVSRDRSKMEQALIEALVAETERREGSI